MNKVEVDFGKWLQDAFELYKANFAVLALAGVMGLLLSSVTCWRVRWWPVSR